jgi:hypothetical protein
MTYPYNAARAVALVNKSDSYGPERDELTEALRAANSYIAHLEEVRDQLLPIAENYYRNLETKHYFEEEVRTALANERTRLREKVIGRLVSIDTEFVSADELGLTELDLYEGGCVCGSTAMPSQCCARTNE